MIEDACFLAKEIYTFDENNKENTNGVNLNKNTSATESW